jgi:hypothetical protein
MMNPLAGPAGPGKFSTRTDNLADAITILWRRRRDSRY